MDAPTELMEPPPSSDPLRPYRAWATVLFAILATVAIVVGAIVLGSPTGLAPSTLAVLIAPAVLGIVVLVVLLVALGRVEPWAVHAIQPVCLVIIVAGVARSVVALAGGEILIPLEVIGGLMVLSRDHRAVLLPPLDPGGRRTMLVAVGLMIVAQVLPVIGLPIQPR